MAHRILPLFLALLLVSLTAYAQESVSWETLGQVKLMKKDNRFVPEFQDAVTQLEGKVITLKGFMMPLDQAAKQQHFILSANPVANCFYCLPGGPESLVEIKTDKPIAFSYDPIEITGTLELLADDPMGMYYRLTNAKAL